MVVFAPCYIISSLFHVPFSAALQRCSSSLLTDELLRVFIGFVNHESYGARALVNVLVEIDSRRHLSDRSSVGSSTSTRTSNCSGGGCGGGGGEHEGVGNGGESGTKRGGLLLPSMYNNGALQSEDGLAQAEEGGERMGRAGQEDEGDDGLASLRRLMGLWLYFHENAQTTNQAKVCVCI